MWSTLILAGAPAACPPAAGDVMGTCLLSSVKRPADGDVLLVISERGIEPTSRRVSRAGTHNHAGSPSAATPIFGRFDQRPPNPDAFSLLGDHEFTDVGVDFAREVRSFADTHEPHHLTIPLGDERAAVRVGEISQRVAHPADHCSMDTLGIAPRRDAHLESLGQLQ